MAVLKRKIGLVVLDILCINISILLAFLVHYEWTIPTVYSSRCWMIASAAVVIAITVFYFFQLYKSLWRYASVSELIMIVSASVVATLLTAVYFEIVKLHIPFSVYIIYCFLTIFCLGGSRISYRILRRLKIIVRNKRLKEFRRVMIVGAGDAGAIIIKELQRHPEMGLKPVAAIDDDPTKQHSKLMGVPICGTREAIVSVAKDKKIDEIIIAIPSARRNDIKEILQECKKTKCKLKTLPAMYELISGKVTIQQIRDVQIEDLLGREPIKLDLEEISGYLRDEVVLVTGGGGSIGSELCRQIARFSPKKLIILDIYENNAYELQQELNRKYPELDHEVVIASIQDRERMESVFSKYRPGVVFHAAAHKHVPLMEANPVEAIKNNVFGTLNVAECADKYNARRFVLISTDKAVNPTNVMGATKRIAEMIIQSLDRNSKTEFVAVRFGNVLGSNGSVIPLFKKQIAEGGPVTVTHPEVNRFFMTIPEAVQLVIQAGAMAKGGEIFILDMGKPVKILDLAKDLIRLSGLEPDVDIKIEFTGLRPGEKLYEELMLEEEGLTATKHEKIFIGKPIFTDIHSLRKEIEKLKSILMQGSSEEIIDVLEHLVPTYRRVG